MTGDSTSTTIPANRKLSTWLGKLEDPDLENGFREYSLSSDRLLSAISVAVVALASVGFVFVDSRLFAGTNMLTVLLVVRGLYFSASLVVLFLLFKISQASSMDRILLIWSLVTCAFVIWVSSTRPSGFTQHIIVSAVLVITVFLLIRMPFLYQCGISLIILAGESALLFLLPQDMSLAFGAELLLILFFVSGTITGWQLHATRRSQYVAWVIEKMLRTELETALADVQELRGMMPICSNCKKIRDDSGYWHQVEVYIRDNSSAEFTHGLCPECADLLYGDMIRRPSVNDT